MKALTVRQPWASLIALGVKTIETRSWRAPKALIGERIAIHAGKARPKDVWCSASADPVFPPPLARLYDYGKCVDPQESNDGEWWRYRWDGPLGAVVAVATLADCAPMEALDYPEPSDASLLCGTAVYLWSDPAWAGYLLHVSRHEHPSVDTDIADQLPYGDFQPGRWAWMLSDVDVLAEPIPAKGKQGLWEWPR